MNYKLDIKQVNIIDLNGIDYRNVFLKQTDLSFEKTIGNFIYTYSNDIDIVNKSLEIHKGYEVVFTEREKPLFVDLINESQYAPMIKRAIIEQIIPE